MELEHCTAPVSNWSFETSNYSVHTTPMKEWELVLKPSPDSTVASAIHDSARRIPIIDNLLELESARRAGLKRVEVIALVLYTGPMVRSFFCFNIERSLLLCLLLVAARAVSSVQHNSQKISCRRIQVL